MRSAFGPGDPVPWAIGRILALKGTGKINIDFAATWAISPAEFLGAAAVRTWLCNREIAERRKGRNIYWDALQGPSHRMDGIALVHFFMQLQALAQGFARSRKISFSYRSDLKLPRSPSLSARPTLSTESARSFCTTSWRLSSNSDRSGQRALQSEKDRPRML